MKKARVKIIKNNIQKGSKVPASGKDSDVGMWVDSELSNNGHKIDKNGIVDLPEYGVDNKSRKQGSRCHHTVGSMTINDIINTPNWHDTRYYKKSLNQNQITWNSDFLEVTEVSVIDMDLPEIQEPLKRAYENLQSKVATGDRRKNITSDCGWAVFDGYNHPNSYRYRITDSAMKKIQNLSRSRDSRKTLFEEI
jgi:hypothetical protein